MLKVSKRSRDWGEDTNMVVISPPCSPHKITTLDSTPSKKLRPVEQTLNQGFSFEPARPDSPFPAVPAEDQKVFALPNNKLKQSKQQNELSEKMFTFNEVKEIVNRALLEKEASLRAEYDRILQELLQEQFRNFSKFNEDYISRQLKSNECSYLS